MGYHEKLRVPHWLAFLNVYGFRNELTQTLVLETKLTVHDYVYVNRGQIPQAEATNDVEHFWIARILEIRASSTTEVYLLVYWMYWPTELPEGAQPYHGKFELVTSNYLEVISAMTISHKADVTHVLEQDDTPAVVGLYWRQNFDFVSKKLSVRKSYIPTQPPILTEHITES